MIRLQPCHTPLFGSRQKTESWITECCEMWHAAVWTLAADGGSPVSPSSCQRLCRSAPWGKKVAPRGLMFNKPSGSGLIDATAGSDASYSSSIKKHKTAGSNEVLWSFVNSRDSEPWGGTRVFKYWNWVQAPRLIMALMKRLWGEAYSAKSRLGFFLNHVFGSFYTCGLG